MSIIYRKAELSDIPKLNPLLAQLSDAMADSQKMAEKMEKIEKNEDNYLLVAENTENGDLCGSLIGVVFEDICDTCKPILLVENVVTDEKYRGKGIGRGMFEAIETWGREKECHYCILVSGLQRTGAHKFYEGKTALGVLYLFTFGLFGTGWIFDLIAILSKKRRYLLHINTQFKNRTTKISCLLERQDIFIRSK